MPVFSYKAFDRTQQCIDGSIIADTAATARQGLREQGLRILELRAATFVRSNPRRRRRESREHAADFARQLALLLRAGIPVVASLDVLIRQQTGRLLPVLQNVRDRVAAGVSLGAALEPHSDWFDAAFRSSVRVGQLSGRMDQALRSVAEYLRESNATRTRVVNALAYPCVLLVLGIGVVVFLMSYVVPQLVSVLEESGGRVPAPTRILKALSDFLVGNWVWIGMAAAVVIGFGSALSQWRPAMLRFHRLQLRLPLVGTLLRKTLMADFAQTMAMLLQNGVPFLEALGLARDNCRHLVLQSELRQMYDAVSRGSDIAPTLAHSMVFPPLVVHIMNVGQKAGELTEMLAQLKEGYEVEVRLAVGRFASALEPALVVLMSVLVGFVVLATILPILETTRAIH